MAILAPTPNDKQSMVLSQPAPPKQLLEVLSSLSTTVTQSSQQVRSILQASPQLTYAILQALLLMGLVDVHVLSAVSAGKTPPPPPSRGSTNSPLPPPPFPPSSIPQRGNSNNNNSNSSTSSSQPNIYNNPDPNSRQAFAQQVMSLSQADIHKLPPDMRATFMNLREQFQRGDFM